MSRADQVPIVGTPSIRQRHVAVKVVAAILFVLGLTGTALAIDQPPETVPQQRAWLLSHLVTDMQSVGSFTSDDIARMVTLVNTLTDDQASLLAQYYYLTRAKTEQDARLYAVQQTESDETLAQAKAEVADLLARLNNQIKQTYSELATISPGCQVLCQITYASVPGWCAYNQYAIPDWYYSDGCYVGPVYSTGYCGAYAVPVYRTFHDRSSRYNYWNSRTYVHNNITRIKNRTYNVHQAHGNSGKGYRHHQPGVAATTKHQPHASFKHGTSTGGAKHGRHDKVKRDAPSYAKHHNQSPTVKHANPMAGVKHGTQSKHNAPLAMKHGSPSQKAKHTSASVGRQKPRPSVKYSPPSKPKSYQQARAPQNRAAHAQPRFQQPKQTVRAPKPAAPSRPQHVTHAQPRPQHASRAQSRPNRTAPAQSKSGHGRHK